SPPLCQQIQFDPPLPPKRAALQRAWPGYSPGRKTATVYSRPFWRNRGLNGSIFTFAGPLIWAYDNSPPGGEIGVIN
ncbi:FAD-dependent oxidoreductase, partial [Klebsiella pneumoniae]